MLMAHSLGFFMSKCIYALRYALLQCFSIALCPDTTSSNWPRSGPSLGNGINELQELLWWLICLVAVSSRPVDRLESS